jgi:hypothetical protein
MSRNARPDLKHNTKRRWTAVAAGSALALGTCLVPLVAAPAVAIPPESHCGTEPGNNNDGFVNHAQLTRSLDRIESTSGGEVAVDVAGQSNQGRDIYTARVGHGDQVVLVESQIHGNENHGTEALLDLLTFWGGNSPAAAAIRDQVTIVAVPRLNVDGGERDTRQNEMTWDDAVAEFPQLEGSAPSWNYNANVEGFDINRDYNPDLDYVPDPADFPGTSADTGWYITPEAQTLREVYRGLEGEFGTVDYFVDLHNQWSCYATEDLESMSPLSISGRFIADPSEFGDWPKFDYDHSRRANVAVYEALQDRGEAGFGDLTLYPQDTNLPGTALGSFALRGSATVLFETSSQTQYDGMKRNGMLRKQIEIGLGGLVESIANSSIDDLDPEAYEDIPERVYLPAD